MNSMFLAHQTAFWLQHNARPTNPICSSWEAFSGYTFITSWASPIEAHRTLAFHEVP